MSASHQPLYPHFRSISRQCRIYLLYDSQNWFCMIICQFSIHCQFEGLEEMCYIWKDPTSKILFSFNKFTNSFVTHSLKKSIISNTSCKYLTRVLFQRIDGFHMTHSFWSLCSSDWFFRDKKWEPSLGKTRK